MHRRRSSPILVTLVAWALVPVAGGLAQAEPKYVGWTKVESCREIRELKEKVREGGAFDANARAFFDETVLPQLALQENRPLIEQTRRRIREVVLADVGDDKVFNEMSLAVAQFMTGLARDEQADAVARVNAMLLVGELKTRDGRPWPGALAVLAAAAGDKALPGAVRIAALAGVARHADKAADGEGAEAIRKVVDSILAEPGPADQGVEGEWIVTRAVQLVPVVAKPIPPKLAATLAGIVADEARPIDVRVRAAGSLGGAADASSGVDAAALVETIRKLAVTVLETEEKAAASRRFEELYRRGGGAAPGMAPGMPPGIGFDGQPLPVIDPAAPSEQACRRVAWRLYALGAAILSADGKQGLATLMGDAAGPAKELAKQLIEEGLRIDQTPDEDALLDALDVVRPPQPGKKRAARPPKADEPKEGDAKPAADPNASPFDNPFP